MKLPTLLALAVLARLACPIPLAAAESANHIGNIKFLVPVSIF